MQGIIAHDIVEIFIPIAFLISELSYAFFGSHIGQQLTNSNAEIFDTV